MVQCTNPPYSKDSGEFYCENATVFGITLFGHYICELDDFILKRPRYVDEHGVEHLVLTGAYFADVFEHVRAIRNMILSTSPSKID